MFFVSACQIEHGEIQGMETSQGHKLKLVSHCPKFVLEFRDRAFVQMLSPVKRGRAVVSQYLIGIASQDGFSKLARILKVGSGSLAPQQISIGSVSQCARDGRFDALTDHE